MVISAAVLVQGAFSYGSLNLGFSVSTFWYGAARVVFGFTLGVLIYPLRHRVVVPGSILPVVGGLSVVAMLMSFLISGPVVQLVSVMVIFPTIVVFASQVHLDHPVGRWLGEISYPLYILHFPILTVAGGIYALWPSINPVAISVAAVVAAAVFSHVVLRVYDVPVRARLGAWQRRREQARDGSSNGPRAMDAPKA